MAGRIQSEMEGLVSTALGAAVGAKMKEQVGISNKQLESTEEEKKDTMAKVQNQYLEYEKELGAKEANDFKYGPKGKEYFDDMLKRGMTETQAMKAFDDRVARIANQRVQDLESNATFKLQKAYISGKIGSYADYSKLNRQKIMEKIMDEAANNKEEILKNIKGLKVATPADMPSFEEATKKEDIE